MKLTYRTNIYDGPKTMEGIVRLSKNLYKSGWATKIYGPPLEERISGEIFGLSMTLQDRTKIFSRILGTIKPGRIETHDYDRGLEGFLANYSFKNLKGGTK